MCVRVRRMRSIVVAGESETTHLDYRFGDNLKDVYTTPGLSDRQLITIGMRLQRLRTSRQRRHRACGDPSIVYMGDARLSVPFVHVTKPN